MDGRSVVQYFGKSKNSSCDYCSVPGSGKCCYGIWAYQLNVTHYQKMLDKGWRRSGHYCYKPIHEESCCTLHTIRCDALEFRPSRSQKRIHRKNFLLLKMLTVSDCNPTCNILDVCTLQVDREQTNSFESGYSERKQKKAKFRRRQRKILKLKEKGIDPSTWIKKQPPVKNLEDYIRFSDESKTFKHCFHVKMIRSSPASSDFNDTFEESFEVFKKYQMAIHNDGIRSWSERKYREFLCESPLVAENFPNVANELGYGSYHCQYWLDGKIIAVGVLDILPNCISSKYFYYDPFYKFLSLGTFSALKEIELTRHLAKIIPQLHFYYMGYYIHNCPKMRYKGNFHPSFLLCTETCNWFPIETCLGMLNLGNCYKFSSANAGETKRHKFPSKNFILTLWHNLENNLIATDYSTYCLTRGLQKDRETWLYIDQLSIHFAMPIKDLKGHQSLLKEIDHLRGKVVFVLFTGSKDSFGKSWCPDCVKADKIIEKYAEKLDPDSVLIRCDVGDRATWKNPENEFRTDKTFHITAIPTLMKLGTEKRLVEEQCCSEELISINYFLMILITHTSACIKPDLKK
ncbi:Arginyl-tRNA--protein transferase 1 [Trichinella pseudospiralis]|uniref:Thioredoxin domain-containing protein 17 n=1 Tax=Trichinella pseudospiralis TaxID=6337 RepID=A0A0V1FKJ7_TRIPS|nr:Arginyl-tRNA--protein transferase 1 [Trichinella pseudospiralis]